MSQSIFKAIIIGPKEQKTALKVIRIAVYFGFFKLLLGILVFFIPWEPLQNALSEATPSRWIMVFPILMQAALLFCLLRLKEWAAWALVLLKVSSGVFEYISSGQLKPSSFQPVELFLYAAALQSFHFLRKNSASEKEFVE